MDSIKKVLMRRDGISEQEAERHVDEVRDWIEEVVEEMGCPVEALLEIEAIILDEFGLEPDYAEELMPL